jgi:translation initiation factor IF-1
MRDASERDCLEMEGRIAESCRGFFVCEVDGLAHRVTARLSGRLNVNRIRCMPGDRIRLEVSPYDTTRGRITRRL